MATTTTAGLRGSGSGDEAMGEHNGSNGDRDRIFNNIVRAHLIDIYMIFEFFGPLENLYLSTFQLF